MRSMSIGVALVAALSLGSAGRAVGCPLPEYDDLVEMEPEAGVRFVTLGRDAVPAAHDVAVITGTGSTYHEIASDGDVSLIELDAAALEQLSTLLHQRTGRCGGFEVHASLDDAVSALYHAHDAEQRPALDYTLDHPEDVATVLPAIDATNIRKTIADLVAMKTRYYRSEGGRETSYRIERWWRELAANRHRVTVELVKTGYPQQSVVMTIPGTTRADEVIVIGAHLDSIAIAGDPRQAPGADDDASGVATLTEVARVLLASDYRPARTIKLMAYAAEEVGLRGSLQIARDYQQRKINVVGALQLDMTNYQGSDKDIWLIDDFTSPAQNQFLARLIERYVGASYGHDKCGYACSDHAAWHRIGVPASMPFEARFKDANREIHTQRDTLETSDNNAAHAAKFARLAAAYAIELGKGEVRGAAPGASPSGRATPMAAIECERGISHRNVIGVGALLLLAAALWRLRSLTRRIG